MSSSTTYYQYRDVKVMIAEKLMQMDGWKVYGYHGDNSDSMTDYYDPAYWEGIAEKNGYILCVNQYRAEPEREIRNYNYEAFTYSSDISEKIKKLELMTTANGATEGEAEGARRAIERLQRKAETESENKNHYSVIGKIPAHMKNPPRMNWHIEKDGVIIAKGNGILKYADVEDYYHYERYADDLKLFRTLGKDGYMENYIKDYNRRHYREIISEKEVKHFAESAAEEMEKKAKIADGFEAFIRKIDNICGGLIGNEDAYTYEKIVVTEYKTEIKAVETADGEIKEGQCFIVKTGFNHGHRKGYIYRIHKTEYDGKISYHAYKLNGKLTKECHGQANEGNYWYITDDFIKWFKKGSLVWCELKDVKTPYEVEKVVKKKLQADKPKSTAKNRNTVKTTTNTTEQTENLRSRYTYKITEDTDTRDNSLIYLVKVAEKLSKEEYIKVNNFIKSIGGYYSKFKHGFIFKENPTAILTV